MSRLNQTARSITSNWLLLVVNVGVLFFLSPFVVNKLGSTYFGIWAVAMQFMGYLYLLDFGVRESVIRYTAKYVARQKSDQLNQLLSTALIIYLPITLGCIVLTGICAWKVPEWFEIGEAHVQEARLAICFVGLTIAQTFVFNVFSGVLQALNRFDIANAIGLAATLLRAVLTVVALSLGYKLVALAVIQFSLAIMGGIAGAFAAARLLRSAGVPLVLKVPTRRRLLALGRKVFGYGFYVLVNNIAQKINFASDAVVIGIFLPVASVTPYAIAGSLIGHLRSLMMSTAQVFSPLSSALHAQRRPEDLAKLLLRGAKLTVIITVPVSMTFAVLGKPFIGLWMGAQYMESAGAVLLVLGLTQIVSAPHYIVSSVLYGMSKHGAMGLLRVVEAAVNLGLSIYLVQRIGIVGVALGTAISHTVIVVLILPVLVSRLVGLSLARYFLGAYAGPLLASVPFVAGAWWMREHLPAGNLVVFFAQVAVLSCIYVLVAYAVALDREERQFIRGLVMRKARVAPAVRAAGEPPA